MGDLAPHNILVADDGSIRVLDFEYSRWDHPVISSGDFLASDSCQGLAADCEDGSLDVDAAGRRQPELTLAEAEAAGGVGLVRRGHAPRPAGRFGRGRWRVGVGGAAVVLWLAAEPGRLGLGSLPVVVVLCDNFYPHGRELVEEPANARLARRPASPAGRPSASRRAAATPGPTSW